MQVLQSLSELLHSDAESTMADKRAVGGIGAAHKKRDIGAGVRYYDTYSFIKFVSLHIIILYALSAWWTESR